ncbi:hydantoinase/oxoprolinase family protein [Arthrobacter crystallopoietes]|jgi:N-methylhydantoinase A|uniref:N-methylhydantoinase A n=1 Tax=Crystallibacter crystallopoietes TaxID=37928 RepID=A0A1H1BWL5_9MICC|nr:hydantoinase/oxoprolinase family protein [Arthrobacter crystallopoietes]AUI51005.1 5-oxoprolinase [Arthrobacter crystallopoietes]SDQ55796.1 N-methylhydantoinase A [Arthrobacter crystallopoietes]
MFGVDVGGTFTDVVAVKDGTVHVTKVPSNPQNPQLAVLEGARRLGVEGSRVFNHASTKGLNAVLTRSLPKVGFLTTEGHRDMLDAGRGWRPFEGQLNPHWRRSFGDAAGRPLVPRYLRRGIPERILSNGSILQPLDEDRARTQLEVFKRCGVEAVAICLINSYVNPQHEQRLKELVREVLGPIPLSISSETSPLSKEYTRASTTVIDVMMKMMYDDYAEQLSDGLSEQGFDGRLNFADCTASLVPWQEALRNPYRILFAGPAAGAASCVQLGKATGDENLICCDVGGTSTDVALIQNGSTFTNDSFEIEFDMVISALSTDISSVGAGGGSIVSITSTGDVQVGPESAGAYPGPACYGRGGTAPTVTDACALMGILNPKDFAGGQIQMDLDAARTAFESLDSPLSFEQRVNYAYRIAVHNIAEEVTNVAIRKGADPRDFSLVAYGSAGPMLLAPLLDILQVKSIIVPPNPGLFSALGLLSTDTVFSDSRTRYLPLFPENAGEIDTIFQEMESELLERTGVDPANVTIKRSFDGRLFGQSWETPFVEVPAGPITEETVPALVEAFHQVYERRNTLRFPAIPVQAATYRVQLVVDSERFEYSAAAGTGGAQHPKPKAFRAVSHFREATVDSPVYNRADLGVGQSILGPAIIEEDLCTTMVLRGQKATAGSFGELRITLA